MNQSQIAGLIRHALSAVGIAGATTSDDEIVKLLGALVALLAAGWSMWSKTRSAQPSAPPSGAGPGSLVLAGALGIMLGVTGCQSPAGTVPIVTPARVEAISALGAYYAGKAAILKGHRAELEQAVKALQVLAASDSADLVAVAAALEAAGVPGIGSSEGALVLGAVSTLSDLWAQTGQMVLQDELARAAIRGLTRGVELALAAARTFRTGDPVGLNLLDEAIATRPAR